MPRPPSACSSTRPMRERCSRRGGRGPTPPCCCCSTCAKAARCPARRPAERRVHNASSLQGPSSPPMPAVKILVAQGGGPTAVINQSLVGVVLEARRFSQVDRVYGARHGVRGIVNEDFVDLTQETRDNLERVAATPGSTLGSTRDKPDLKYCQQIFEVLRAHGIGYFFYIEIGRAHV